MEVMVPSREEERNANNKSDMRYCTEHRTYYYEEFGCQQCAFDEFKPRTNAGPNTELKKCLKCKRISLFWNSRNGIYECLNKKCKRQFTQKQMNVAKAKGEIAMTDDEPRKEKEQSS